MTASRDTLRLGFLTTVEQANDCFVGGLLITNHLGRPLEFQCTTPVRPNSTQKILYGPTLKPFVMTELIGKTLYERADVKPDVLLVEDDDLLGLRELIDKPVACLSLESQVPAMVGGPEEEPLTLGQQHLRVHHAHDTDRGSILKRSHLLPEQADLQEPFERVREALQEVLNPGATR
ncbi:MAG: hypothetical protein HUJ26_05950 [Planctomycetaceae bacterium]|nr:hypothetical protein [Planctomycetaceae bacterium]